MKVRLIFALALVGLMASYRPAWAVTPFDRDVDASEDMEHDSDTFTPSDNDPLGDPAFGGLPPGAPPGHPGGPPDFIVGHDWREVRTGDGAGVIEEVPSGFGGVLAPVGSYNGHVAAPHSAGNFAILQFDGGDGPYHLGNRQVSSNPVPGGTGGRTGFWATSDLYIDPTRPYGGADGIPDFWWTNAVNAISSGSYMSESGMTGTVDPAGTTWSIHTTAGVLLAVVPVGDWIGLEVEPKLRVSDGGLDFEHRVYSDGGSHAIPIATFTAPAPFTGPGAFADMAGPRYNWYTFNQANIPYLYVDNVGWTAVPEPGTIVMAGFGAVGLVIAARRRRRA